MTEGKSDELKGRVKQAAGDLTGNQDLRREGKNDERGGKIKQHVEDAKDKIEEGVDKIKAKVDHRND